MSEASLMPKYDGMSFFIISARFFSEYWSALRVPRTKGHGLGGIGFDFFVGKADATVGIHVVAGIGDAVKAVVLEHKISWRRYQRRDDSPVSQGDHRFFLGSDNDDRDILVRRETVFL